MSEMKDRITEVAKHFYGTTVFGFERKCGIPKSTLGAMKENVSGETLKKIALACPELSIEYLITGNGSPINSKEMMDAQLMKKLSEMEKRLTEVEMLLNIREK